MGHLEIEQISDYEFHLGENVTTLLDGNIIYVVAKGEQTKEIAQKHQKIVEILGSKVQGKINYLIDVNQSGKNSPEARDIWKMLSSDEKTNKVAVFGLNPVAKVLASFVIGNYKKKNLLFFKTKEEAMHWLIS